MNRQRDMIATEPVADIKCAGCKREIDVKGRPSFSSINCPACGASQVVPARFGSFVLLGRLGAGGMGVIYHAIDRDLGRHVALKVMKKSLGDNPDFVKSFRQEARSAAALNHPNVVQIYSFGQHDGQPYIVMELVSGGGLDELIDKQERLDEVEALKIHIEVAEGLKAASAVGLVHGDIKPANILFGANGEAKVVDFGLASFIGQQREDEGQVWGTPYYIAPEKARKKKVDYRSDIYSLGATMFHALSGRPPFDGATPLDVVLARLRSAAPDIASLREDVHPETAAMIARMLEREPIMRYPSYPALLYDMREALVAARDGVGGQGRTTRFGGASSLDDRDKKRMLVVGGMIVGALLVAGGVLSGVVAYRNHRERVAAEAVEKAALDEAQSRGMAAYSRAAERAADLSDAAGRAEHPAEKVRKIAESLENGAAPAADAMEHVENLDQLIEQSSSLMIRATRARHALETAPDSAAAYDAADLLVSIAGSLDEAAVEASKTLAAVERSLETVRAMREDALIAAEEARREAEREKALEEARRRELLEKQEAERVRRETIQRELDLVDEARGANAAFIAERKFQEAIESFVSALPPMTMPETRAAYENVLEAYAAMAGLKRFMVESIGKSPYRDGWVLGRATRDIVGAHPEDGLEVALGAAGSMIIPWEHVTVSQFLTIATHYIRSRMLSDHEQAGLFLSMALFCYETGDFRRAEAAAGLAARLNPLLKTDIERMMPGLLPEDGDEQARREETGGGD